MSDDCVRFGENGCLVYACTDTSLCCQGNVCHSLGLLLVILRILILAQGLCLSLACHSKSSTQISALPTNTNHEFARVSRVSDYRTFSRRRYLTWRRDLASPLLAMECVFALANLCPCFGKNGRVVFMHACTDTSLCCQGNVCHSLGLSLVILRVLILAQGLCLSLACHSKSSTQISALPTNTNHEFARVSRVSDYRTFSRRRYLTWRRDLASPLLAMECTCPTIFALANLCPCFGKNGRVVFMHACTDTSLCCQGNVCSGRVTVEVCGALERRASRPDRPLLGALACDPASTYPGAGTLLVPCLPLKVQHANFSVADEHESRVCTRF